MFEKIDKYLSPLPVFLANNRCLSIMTIILYADKITSNINCLPLINYEYEHKHSLKPFLLILIEGNKKSDCI